MPETRRLSGVLAAVLTAWGVASHAAPLQRGDLLVTDSLGARVVRVDSAGGVETFSPPPGGANFLQSPRGITVVDDGPVFVIDVAAGLIEIDRTTGAQSLAQDSSGLGPVDVGYFPTGIDHFVRPTGLALYVAAISPPGLWLVSPNLDFGGFDSVQLTDVPGLPRGVGVRPDATGLDVEEVWFGTSGEGLWSWRAGVGSEQVLPPNEIFEGGEWFSDVEFTHSAARAPVFTKWVYTAGVRCAEEFGGVFTGALGVAPIRVGGLLRCPSALALVPGRAEIFVADTGTTGRRDGRIVRLASAGGIWYQTLFVDAATLGVAYPEGLAFVPEPAGAALAAAALATLGLLARKRVRRQRFVGVR